ncbi:ImmA/IrrE family metallo-endopeptidase [uncultured Tissierella sp.]|uniref:ImmA/IrrE family metallo-endopeptidase n=1 Tax=uncultured Tissierella sp. TaxID=448160 RepID=UPI0028062080|nr:ImmA/IrrE family metallo-endopeptidase [uncultured Tissierella sp.]MDU5080287.1 ImmA/IrrE family metallo-endopeptidase [Bacillota bacterium]
MTKDTVKRLVELYGTRNPFDICAYLDIKVNFSDLGKKIMGFYQRTEEGIIILHINNRLDEKTQEYICTHELGHAMTHPEMNLSFFIENPLLIKSKYEIEADTFAAELLLEDNLSDTYEGYTIEQIALAENVPVRLVELKCKNLSIF